MQKLRSENLNFLVLAWAWYKHEKQKLGQRVEGEERVPLSWFIWQLMASSLHLSLLGSQRLGTTIPQKWHRHGAERVKVSGFPHLSHLKSHHMRQPFEQPGSVWELTSLLSLRIVPEIYKSVSLLDCGRRKLEDFFGQKSNLIRSSFRQDAAKMPQQKWFAQDELDRAYPDGAMTRLSPTAHVLLHYAANSRQTPRVWWVWCDVYTQK